MNLNRKWVAVGTSALAGLCAAGTAFVSLEWLRRLAVGRKAPKLRVKSETQEALQAAREEYAEELNAGVEWLENTPHADISITSFDGLKLRGHLYTYPRAKRTVLMMHGYRSSWKSDFCGAAKEIYESGCNLLLAEQRAHGESEGKTIGFGVLERYDCAEWLRELTERFGDLPLYADGISMGATTVLMATGLNLPEQVKGIIADCGFTSPYDIMDRVFTAHSPIPAKLVLPGVSLYNKAKGSYGFSDYSTLEALADNQIPVFFAHGDADNFVPLDMTLAAYEACKAPKTLLIAHGAGHGMSWMVERERYKAMLADFFARCEA